MKVYFGIPEPKKHDTRGGDWYPVRGHTFIYLKAFTSVTPTTRLTFQKKMLKEYQMEGFAVPYFMKAVAGGYIIEIPCSYEN